MGLETFAFIDSLNASNPIPGDARGQGDDHIRGIKSTLQATFPNAGRAQYFPRGSAKTADFTIAAADMEKVFACDCTSDHIDVTLPTLTAQNDGWACRFIKTDATANTVRIAGTINGDAAGFNITLQYQAVVLLWTGTAWIALPTFNVVSGVATFGAMSGSALTLSGLLTLSSASHLLMAGGTTAQRPGAPAEKSVRLNSTLSALEFYLNSAWNVVQADKVPKGWISGGILSNGTDAVNDINITAGVCRDFTDTVTIVLPANTAGKQLDANWVAAGTTNSGMRHSGAGIADGTYHIYAARTAASPTATYYAYPGVAGTNPDTSAAMTTVLTALQAEPGGGADYIYARRIGSILRVTSILGFTQRGDEFWLTDPILDVNTGAPGVIAVTVTLSVPKGPIVKAFGVVRPGDAAIYISALTSTDSAPNTTPGSGAPVGIGEAAGGTAVAPGNNWEAWTNTSGQVRRRQTANTSCDLDTRGWIDPRGRDA